MSNRLVTGALLALAAIACSDSDTGDESRRVDVAASEVTAGADIKALFDASRVIADMNRIVALGERVTGGPGEALVGDLVAERFTELGLNVTTESFPMFYYLDHGATFALAGTSASPLSGLPAQFSVPGNITARVIDCGIGQPTEFPTGQSGYIALMRRGTLPFAVKEQNALAAGAGAVVVSNNASGINLAYAGFGPLPIVTISQEDGVTVREQLAATPGLMATLVVNTVREMNESRNIIGSLEGTSPESGTLYIGAHYDSLQGTPGANDNATSVAAVIEAARVLTNGHRMKANVKFIAFGAEEWYRDGSYTYITEHEQEIRSSAIGMINLELIGVGDRLMLGNTEAPHFLVKYAERKATAMGLTWEEFVSPAESDHTPFEELGVPTLVVHRDPIGEEDDPAMHTADDVPANVVPTLAETAGELVTAVAYDWAKNPPLRARKATAMKAAENRPLDNTK